MSGAGPSELAIPFAVHEANEASEILRAWIVDNGLHVSLQRGFDDPAVWGVLLTDLARHVSRIYETEGVGTQAEALAKIKFTLDAEWDDGTDVGTTSAIQ